ncbi:hypothetical protein BU15DRAFT_81615 [Melanogaster broomeanus]|nr:hypothetical protein BU15DRAFT_81615 [Melanogaster broomeanus]
MGAAWSIINDNVFPGSPKYSANDIPDMSGKVVLGHWCYRRDRQRDCKGESDGLPCFHVDPQLAVLLTKNAKVWITARSKSKGEAMLRELKKQHRERHTPTPHGPREPEEHQSSCRGIPQETHLNVLFNNAGVMAPPMDQLTDDGYDLQFGTNVLGHFYFTTLVLPLLLSTAKSAPDGIARVVNTSSNGHWMGKLNFNTWRDGPARRKQPKFHCMDRARQSGNIVFSAELKRRYGDQGIVSTSLNPGGIRTEITRHVRSFADAILLYAGTVPDGASLNGKYLIPWARIGKPRTDTQILSWEKNFGLGWRSKSQTYEPFLPDIGWPAIKIPDDVFEDDAFLSELVNFLVHMNDDRITDALPVTYKAGSQVEETRDTVDPRYVTELLTGILRGIGHPADIVRISKRIGDDVVYTSSLLPWRRSSLWLVIRVALQTTLEQPEALGRQTYTAFMIFFMHELAQKAIEGDMSSELLHFMSTKISRRLMKLASSAPDWLSCTVLKTCTGIREILETRWKLVQNAQSMSPRWAPDELDYSGDTQLSLLKSRGYIRDALMNQGPERSRGLFELKHRPRGTLDDFLSSDGEFFEDAYLAEPHVTLYDVEQAVGQGIDDWVAWDGWR